MTDAANNIVALINQYVRNDALVSYSNLRLNRILNLMVQLADANAGGASATSVTIPTYTYNSASFADHSNPTTVADSRLNGLQYSIYVNELQRYLLAGEFSYITGGGFKVNLANFDPSTTSYYIVVQINTSSNGLLLPVTSADFTDATSCPLANFANNKLAVFCNELQKFLTVDAGEISYLPGGGFKVLLPNFDSTTTNYHFYVSAI